MEIPISGFVVDAFHRASKTVVLYHGDFWHCNPRTFKDSNQYCKWLGRTVSEQWKRDQRAVAAFYKYGYRVVIVWESDAKRDQSIELQRIITVIRGVF
jgi:G:T-mismatch repair DNA endonuclease (very short patch repair protein)